MKEKVQSVFSCDFCKKKLYVRHAMLKHEENCTLNPKNFCACSGCIHCEETEKEYQIETVTDGYYHEEIRQTKGFKCTKLNQQMYPFICVKKGLLKKYPDMFDGEIQMLVTCEHQELVQFEGIW